MDTNTPEIIISQIGTSSRKRSTAVAASSAYGSSNGSRKASIGNASDAASELTLGDAMSRQREANIATALRLIRKVGRPTTPDKSSPKTLKKPPNKVPSLSYKNEAPIVLHNVEDIYKEAQSAYHHRVKTSPERRHEEEATAKKNAANLRPISASIISEIMSTESCKMQDCSNRVKARRIRQARSMENSACLSEKAPFSDSGDTCPGGEAQHRKEVNENPRRGGGLVPLEIPQPGNRPHSPGPPKNLRLSDVRTVASRRESRSSLVERDSILRKRDDLICEEEQRRAMLIEDKKRRSVERTQLVSLRNRQNMWLVILATLLRTRKLAAALENKRLARFKKAVRKVQRGAIRRIELFWKSHRVISKMRRNPESLAKIRVAVMVYWRRRKVGERSTAIDMIQRFLVDIGGVSDRTQKVYRYRARVVKIQRWVRSFLECQNARILILWLSLQKLLVKTRITRNNEISLSERSAVSKMKKTKFFGVTVQKLDEVYNNLSALMSQKQQVYKTLMNQQRHIENLVDTRSPGKRNYNRAQSWQRSGGNKYTKVLQSILWKQRRRHILSDESDWGQMQTKTSVRQAVDDADVKAFLKTPGHPGPIYILNSISNSASSHRKAEPFLLLTGGGLRELEALAFSIVMSEDGSKLSSLRSMNSGSSIPSRGADASQDDVRENDDIFLFDDDEGEDDV